MALAVTAAVVITISNVGARSRPVAALSGLLVANDNDSSVLRYDESTGAFIDVFITPGSGGLDTPIQMIVGPDGRLYVSSYSTNEVKRYDASTGAFVDTFVTAGSGGLQGPLGLAFDTAGNLLVNSYNNAGGILRYDRSTGAFLGQFIQNDPSNGTYSIDVGPDGYLYYGTIHIDRYDRTTGALVDTFGTWSGPEPILGVAFGPDSTVYGAVDHGHPRIVSAASLGSVFTELVPSGTGGLGVANDVRVGPDGLLYVADNFGVIRFDRHTGAFIDRFISLSLNGAENLIFLSQTQSPTADTYVVCPQFDQTKSYKAGSTIPIKLHLCDAAGNNRSSASVPLTATGVVLVSTNAAGPLEDSGNANPDNQFRFDGGTYVFNLSLKGFSQGTYALTFTAAGDPVPHNVQFKVR